MKLNLEIDYDVADTLAVTVLKNYRDSLIESLENHKNGGWMHEDDVVHANKMVQAINFVIKDFAVE